MPCISTDNRWASVANTGAIRGLCWLLRRCALHWEFHAVPGILERIDLRVQWGMRFICCIEFEHFDISPTWEGDFIRAQRGLRQMIWLEYRDR